MVRCKWWLLELDDEQRHVLGIENQEKYCEDFVESTQQIPDLWLPHPFYANEQFWSQYWQSIFWAVEATTGVGSDIAPIRSDEIILTITVGMFGLMITALIIGSAGSALYNMDSAGAEKRSNLEGISAYLTKRKVPTFFQKIVADFYDHKWSLPIGENNKILHELPHTLRTRLELVLKAELVNRVNFFWHVGPEYAIKLIRMLTPVVFLPGEYVAQKNDKFYKAALYVVHCGVVDEIEIIVRPTEGPSKTLSKRQSMKSLLNSMNARRASDVTSANRRRSLFLMTPEYPQAADSEKILRTIQHDNVFGEETLLGRAWQYQYRAVQFCDLLRLSDIDFRQICRKNPEFRTQYEGMVRELEFKREHEEDKKQSVMNRAKFPEFLNVPKSRA